MNSEAAEPSSSQLACGCSRKPNSGNTRELTHIKYCSVHRRVHTLAQCGGTGNQSTDRSKDNTEDLKFILCSGSTWVAGNVPPHFFVLGFWIFYPNKSQ